MVTIHDCLVAQADQAKTVREIMVEAFESVGVRPTIKVAAFDQEAQDRHKGDPGMRRELTSQFVVRFY